MRLFTLISCLLYLNIGFSQSEDFQFPSDENSDTKFVHDFDSVFTQRERTFLSKKIESYERKTSREIAIVTVASIDPYEDIADYSLDLFNEWGIGKSESDNGLLILVCISIRKIRIATGISTSEILTDQITKDVMDTYIIPEFKEEKYFDGIKSGMLKLMKIWDS